MSTIVFEPLHPGVVPPARATAQSAGHDLVLCLAAPAVKIFTEGTPTARAVEEQDGVRTITLAPGEKALLPLGFKARLPAGYEAQVRPGQGRASRPTSSS